ncbi:talin_middle and talin-RS domain-containing protein rhea isoform X1 [Leptinotarsa decemlineata]|uniref:talin_middle and talin-RS domain-containing protein rhea isoform X1 n=2 Tax=Leptinotarsa decemlineata TaxID=7539 RepID=UPI003D306F70
MELHIRNPHVLNYLSYEALVKQVERSGPREKLLISPFEIKMALSLKINILDGNVTKTIVFDPSTSVHDACRIIQEKCTEAHGQSKDYGLFLTDEDNKTGVWLEPGRNLEYYILRNGDMLEYRKKLRALRVKMLDGTIKTMMVDDSQIIANLMVVICTKLGITNHDEYSLVLEEPENQENVDNRNYGTLTLKRKKEERERDVKMDLLRKKLHTEDEVNWLDPAKTLREQGIDENETVLLKRKFFYSDQNIDSRDPVQLNLLYVQARDAILNGTHPITQDMACEFAGIQCQIQFGDHVDTKHKPGFLDLKEFLPQSYTKTKGIEKKIFSEHKKNQGLTELDAKVKYTKKARSLSTYGVTFFLVKEKMKAKNKLVPRLLGVTKDSVMRLDEKTKEILETWPLTQVRRWGASPNTFTLDFGDYSTSYYSVQTPDGEQIQQIIAGYIDIILKKKQAKDHFGIDGNEGSTMFEESVEPHNYTILQHKTDQKMMPNTESLSMPGIWRPGDGEKSFSTGIMGGAQSTTISQPVSVVHVPPASTNVQQTKLTSILTEPQRGLISTISATQTRIKESEIELQGKVTIPELGTDPAAKKWKKMTLDTRKQNVGSQIAAMSAATAQVVTLTSGPQDEVDHTAVGAAITTIGSNLPEMTKDVKIIAALMDDDNVGEKLLDATRQLCSAFSDLLRVAEPESKEPRQNLLSAASRVGEASTQVLATISEETVESKELQDMLLSLAKAVANTTAALVLKAKNISSTCEDQHVQNRVIGAATQCALATSQLVACAKVVAPTLHSPACQEQLKTAIREVANAVENLVVICNESCSNEDLNGQLKNAAADVTRTLNDLLNHMKLASRQRARETVQEHSVEEIYTATDKLSAASGDANEMVRQARLLGQATAQLIQSIKGEAEKLPDSDIQRRLLAAAKTLADATAKMVEAARQCASNPHDVNYQDMLRRTAEDLRDVTVVAATTPALRAKLVDRVQVCARKAVSSATQCITAAQASHSHNTNIATREALSQDTQELAETIPLLVESIKANGENPEDTNGQVELMYVAEVFLHPASQVVQSSRSVLPTLTDHQIRSQLSSTSQKLNTELSELHSAISRAKPACQGLGLDAANQLIADLQEELDEFERAVQAHKMRPLPDDTPERGAQQLAASSKLVNQGVAQLLSAAAQGNEMYTSQAARDTAHSLKSLTGAVRTVVATTDNVEVQRKIIHSGQELLAHSAELVIEAQKSLKSVGVTPGLQKAAKNIGQALNATIGCLPGQRDVDTAITNIIEWSSVINTNNLPQTDKSFGELQQELNSAAANLNEASSSVVQSVYNPVQLSSSSKDFAAAYHDLLTVSAEMAGQTPDTSVRGEMVHSLKNVSTTSSALLTTAKSLSADPNLPNGKNQLAAAARAVTESINFLVNICTSAAPGQNECDNAIRKVKAMQYLLDNPTEPINESSYYEALDTVIEKSKMLGEGLTGITASAKASDHEKFAEHVKGFTNAICSLVETSAQTAYLIGVSDPSSIAGRPGLVDQAQFARASQAIQQGCAALSSSVSPQKQVLEAATLIAKHTSALCNSCRVASSKTSNPVAKRQFVQSAKAVANSTAALVKEIKALDANYSEENRRRCAEATRPLLDAVENLCVYASSSEFVSIPAKISQQALQAQKPIIESGRRLIDSSCAVINATKNLIIMPKDPSTWQQFAASSKNVSDSMKQLVVNIRNEAPGRNECEQAAQIITNHLKSLDAAYMDAVSQSLKPQRSTALPIYSQQVERSAAGLLDTIEPLRHAAKFEAENIGHGINQLIQFFEPLVESTIGAASNMTNSKQQEQLLDQAKSVAESALQLVYCTKDCGGNPKALNIHPEIDESANSTRDTLKELVANLEAISTQSGIVSGVVDNLTRAMTRLTDNRASLIISDSDLGFVDYQTRMVDCAKAIAKIAGEISTKAATDTHNIAQLSANLSHKYAQLSNDSIGAAAAATNGDVAIKLKEVVQQLGGACVELVQAGGQCLVQKDDIILREVGECSRNVSEKVSRVLATLQSGSRGTQACINAASTVSGIIGDLETTIMFATAGNLNPENEQESFADHRENILKTAKALVEDTKTLVAGAASSQEQLAVAAQNSVKTIVDLAEVVKFGAASLGADNPDSQVMLINAVRDVASALGDLIQATKAASGKPINDPAMAHLKDSAKVMVTNVTSLLKTVKAVEDEHTRGTRALESTVEAIGQEMRAIYSADGYKQGVTAEEMIRCTKSITTATAKCVSAGISNKQDDIIAAANLSRKSISSMLIICKGAAYSLAETEELRRETLNTGHECAKQFRELLLLILQGNGSADVKQMLPAASRKIAQSVTDLLTLAKKLKGSDFVDPEDPTVIAENELLGAAASIDAAAKKLASLQPRQTVKTHDVDETLNFDEMIIDAAKSIAAATSALVKAASAAQRELIDAGKVSGTPVSSSDDGQWSEGLISAARLVASATHTLVESANALVQGFASEEKLIASAKQVASSTAQLLVACKVKAEGDTEATRRLHSAGNAVIRSTDNLVRAAQQSKNVEEEHYLVLNKKAVLGYAQELDQVSEIIRIERELEEARNKLSVIRQAKYRQKGNETSGDDTDGYVSSIPDQDSMRYVQGYDSSHSHPSPQQKFYADTYSQLESPEKVNSLERNKNVLKAHINSLDSATYGGTNSYGQDYGSAFTQNAPRFSPKDNYTSSPSHMRGYEPLKTDSPFQSPKHYSDGYSSSEYATNTYKTPDGYKSNTFKYESYHSTPQPTYSSSIEKYYTSKPAVTSPLEKKSFETFRNGSNTQYQSSFSSNVEYINEAPQLKSEDTLEQKMLKKSVSQQIIEKKTVSMTKSSKQESSTRSFRFE